MDVPSDLHDLKAAYEALVENPSGSSAKAISMLLARESSAFVSQGGTVDVLAVELSAPRFMIRNILQGRWPVTDE